VFLLGFVPSKEAAIPAEHLRVQLITRYESQLAVFIRSEGHVRSVPSNCSRPSDDHAFTILELVIVLTIMRTLATMSIPILADAVESAYVAQAIGDIRTLQIEITRYNVQMGKLSDSLNELGISDLVDPWGNQYRYLNFNNAKESNKWGGTEEGTEKPRKDRFLVPINSTYDLYSMGKDGESREALDPNESVDDIVRASDGSFIGLAPQY